MPKLKRNVSSATEFSGFEPYDGPTPPAGMYRAIVKTAKVTKAGTGRFGIVVGTELKATEGSEAAKFDGFFTMTNIWFGDEEALQSREKAFYIAIAGKAEVDIVHDEIEDGGKITKIGGKNPIGSEVLVDLRKERYNDEDRMRGDTLYKTKTSGKKAEPVEEEIDEDYEDAGEEIEIPTQAELNKMKIAELRALAEELGIDTDEVKKKADLIAAILDEDESDEDESEEDEDEDEESEDLEDAEDEDDDEEDEDEDEEEEEEDGDEEDAEALLREELSELSRVELKKRLKESDEEFKVLKKHTDDDLRNAIVDAELGEEAPF